MGFGSYWHDKVDYGLGRTEGGPYQVKRGPRGLSAKALKIQEEGRETLIAYGHKLLAAPPQVEAGIEGRKRPRFVIRARNKPQADECTLSVEGNDIRAVRITVRLKWLRHIGGLTGTLWLEAREFRDFGPLEDGVDYGPIIQAWLPEAITNCIKQLEDGR